MCTRGHRKYYYYYYASRVRLDVRGMNETRFRCTFVRAFETRQTPAIANLRRNARSRFRLEFFTPAYTFRLFLYALVPKSKFSLAASKFRRIFYVHHVSSSLLRPIRF